MCPAVSTTRKPRSAPERVKGGSAARQKRKSQAGGGQNGRCCDRRTRSPSLCADSTLRDLNENEPASQEPSKDSRPRTERRARPSKPMGLIPAGLVADRKSVVQGKSVSGRVDLG